MLRAFCILLVVASTEALATGERVALVPADSALRPSVCVSMACDASRPEATVRTRAVKGGLELTVTMASGQKRLTHLLVTRPDGTASSTDLVHAAALALRAIEVGPTAGTPLKAPVAVRHRPRGKILARR
jgi:hypothetical protein